MRDFLTLNGLLRSPTEERFDASSSNSSSSSTLGAPMLQVLQAVQELRPTMLPTLQGHVASADNDDDDDDFCF